MKNPFKLKKTGADKAIRPPNSRSSADFSFSQLGSPDKREEGSGQSSEDKRTKIGSQHDLSSLEKGAKELLLCPKCNYPLRIEPLSSSPCPNCGYYNTENTENTLKDKRRTISLEELNLQEEDNLSKFKFRLISESSGSVLKVESSENEIILNRSHLDPSNTTISSKEHLLIKYREGKIYIQNVSSNGSTFIQVIKKMSVRVGSRIVMGNRIFLLSSGKNIESIEDSNATRKLYAVSLNQDRNEDFALIEEKSSRRMPLYPGINIFKRSNLDPGNISISDHKHAELEFREEKWFISDFSSNCATFVQCSSEQQISDMQRIIVGNVIFRFEYN